MRMNKIKSLYEAPTIDILEVRFEGMVCTSPWDPKNHTENVIPDPYEELGY